MGGPCVHRPGDHLDVNLEPVVRPGTKLDLAILAVKGKQADVYLAAGCQDAGREPCDLSCALNNDLESS